MTRSNPHPPKVERLVDASEIARLTGLKSSIVRALTSQRRLPVHKLGRVVRYNPAEILAFLEQLLKLYQKARSPLNYVIKQLDRNYESKDPRVLANRTVTGKVFSELLATDSMYSLATTFLTRAEIESLIRSQGRSHN